MPPVKLEKRERQATPDFNTADQSIGQSLLGVLKVAQKGAHDVTKIMAMNDRTDAQNDRNKSTKEIIDAQAEEVRVTKLLQDPTITPSESIALALDSKWNLARVAAFNRAGEVRAQESFGDLAVAMEDAGDTVQAREILGMHLGKALEGVKEQGVIDGITQRYADFAPKFLSEAAKKRVARDALNKSVEIDILLSTALESESDVFMESLTGQAETEFGTGGEWTTVVDQGLTAISNFYESGKLEGGANFNQEKAFDSLDDLINSPVSSDAGNKKRALALRSSMEADIERSFSGRKAVEDDENEAIYEAAQLEAMALQKAGKMVPQHLYNIMAKHAVTDAQRARLVKISDNMDAPGMTGTQEYRETRSGMRSQLGTDSTGTDFNGEFLGWATSYFDKGARRLAQIEDISQRYDAFDALSAASITYAQKNQERKDMELANFEMEQAERAEVMTRFQELGASDEQVLEALDDLFTDDWVKYQKQNYLRSIDKWAQANGIRLKDLDL